MTEIKFKSRKQLYTLLVTNRKNNRSVDLINILIFSDCFVKLLNMAHSEMQNKKNEFFQLF